MPQLLGYCPEAPTTYCPTHMTVPGNADDCVAGQAKTDVLQAPNSLQIRKHPCSQNHIYQYQEEQHK